MKKILFIIFIFILSLHCLGKCNAQTIVKPGQKITSADTVTTELQFDNVLYQPTQLVYIQVDSANTGTLKFTVSKTGNEQPITPASEFTPFHKGAKILISIDNGNYNLFYKASGAGQSFTLTY